MLSMSSSSQSLFPQLMIIDVPLDVEFALRESERIKVDAFLASIFESITNSMSPKIAFRLSVPGLAVEAKEAFNSYFSNKQITLIYPSLSMEEFKSFSREISSCIYTPQAPMGLTKSMIVQLLTGSATPFTNYETGVRQISSSSSLQGPGLLGLSSASSSASSNPAKRIKIASSAQEFFEAGSRPSSPIPPDLFSASTPSEDHFLIKSRVDVYPAERAVFGDLCRKTRHELLKLKQDLNEIGRSLPMDSIQKQEVSLAVNQDLLVSNVMKIVGDLKKKIPDSLEVGTLPEVTMTCSAIAIKDPLNDQRFYISVNILGKVIALRSPSVYIVHLDCSESMRGQRWTNVKAALNGFIANLNEDDEFGLMTFNSRTEVKFPIMQMTEANKQLILKKIDMLIMTGNTIMYPGIIAGLQTLFDLVNSSGKYQTRDGHLIVFTDGGDNGLDGEMNEGKAEIYADRLSRAGGKNGANIKLSIIGVDMSPDDPLLTFARNMGGIYLSAQSSTIRAELEGIRQSFSIPVFQIDPNSSIRVSGKILNACLSGTALPSIIENTLTGIHLHPVYSGQSSSILLHVESLQGLFHSSSLSSSQMSEISSKEVIVEMDIRAQGGVGLACDQSIVIKVEEVTTENASQIFRQIPLFSYHQIIQNALKAIAVERYKDALKILFDGYGVFSSSQNQILSSSMNHMYDAVYQVIELQEQQEMSPEIKLTLSKVSAYLYEASDEILESLTSKLEERSFRGRTRYIKGLQEYVNAFKKSCLNEVLGYQKTYHELMEKKLVSQLQKLHVTMTNSVIYEYQEPLEITPEASLIKRAASRGILCTAPSRVANKLFLEFHQQHPYTGYDGELKPLLVNALLRSSSLEMGLVQLIVEYMQDIAHGHLQIRGSALNSKTIVVSVIKPISSKIDDYRYHVTSTGLLRPFRLGANAEAYDTIIDQHISSLTSG